MKSTSKFPDRVAQWLVSAMIVAFHLHGRVGRGEVRTSRTDLTDRSGLHATCDKELAGPSTRNKRIRTSVRVRYRIPPAALLAPIEQLPIEGASLSRS